jgi:PHD/YefM family antitoxin component YafN of YafNO toxin-antitoxin module
MYNSTYKVHNISGGCVKKVGKLMERETDQERKSQLQILFGRDQLVNTATISRQFSKVKLLARVKPLFITDNGAVDSVLLSYEAYEQMYNRLRQLEEEVLDYRAEEAARDPEVLVDWQSVRRSKSKE